MANMAWFRTLNTSHLNFTEKRSVSWKFLNMPMSSCAIPGCRRTLRAFPISPAAGAEKCSCIEVRVLAVGHVVIVIVKRAAIVDRVLYLLNPGSRGRRRQRQCNGRPSWARNKELICHPSPISLGRARNLRNHVDRGEVHVPGRVEIRRRISLVWHGRGSGSRRGSFRRDWQSRYQTISTRQNSTVHSGREDRAP